MSSLIAYLLAADDVNVSEGGLVLALIVLLVALLVAVLVYVVGNRTAPEYAGPAALLVFVVGAILALLVAF